MFYCVYGLMSEIKNYYYYYYYYYYNNSPYSVVAISHKMYVYQ